MATAAPRALRQAIDRRTFDPVYHLRGDNDFLKEETLAQLIAAAVDPATRDFNLEVRRGPELDAELLGSLLGTPPMMADRRVIAIRDVPGLKKDARAALERYLAKPQSDLLLVLISPAGAKADKTIDEVATVVEFRQLTDNEVTKWIEHQVQLSGASIAPDAAALLFEAVGNDLPQLALELDKLGSYSAGAMIDVTAVQDVVGVRRGETLGDLLDRVADRDAAKALELLPIVLSHPKNNGVYVVMALAAQTLAIGWARAQRDSGTRSLEGPLYDLLKANPSSLTARPWGEAVKTWARAVDRWSASDIDAALETLLAADRALKESRISTEDEVLESTILSLCAPRARERAA